MAFIQNPVFTAIKSPDRGLATISTGTGSSTFVTVFTGPANGAKVFAFMATATTTQAQDVQWGILNATSSFNLMSTVSVPAFAGSLSSLNGVDLMNNTNQPALSASKFFYLTSSADSLVAKSPIAVVSGQIYLTASSADF